MYVGSLVNKGIPYSELSDKMEIFFHHCFSTLFCGSVLEWYQTIRKNWTEIRCISLWSLLIVLIYCADF